jgi:hypothetical protein
MPIFWNTPPMHYPNNSPFRRFYNAPCIMRHAALIEEESEFQRLANVKQTESFWKTLLMANPITFPLVLGAELVLSSNRIRPH